MVKITRVYTKKGDKGMTHSSKSVRMSKNSLRVEALGLLDELNSFLGWIVVLLQESNFQAIENQVLNIQNNLFDMGAYICQTKKLIEPNAFFSNAARGLEEDIDAMNSNLIPLNSFVLPGGSELSARFHIARTVCRRAECKLVAYAEEQNDSTAIPYINRLSDWLFVVARLILKKENKEERLWVPSWEK